MHLGYTEIILIILVVLLLFGAKRIPELARALGKAKKEFQKAKDEVETEVEEVSSDDPSPKTEEKKEN